MPIQVPKPNETPAPGPHTQTLDDEESLDPSNAITRLRRSSSRCLLHSALGTRMLASLCLFVVHRNVNSHGVPLHRRTRRAPHCLLRLRLHQRPAPAARLAAHFAKRPPRCVALRAGISSGVEPDLEEDNRDIHATAGEDMEEMFPYGEADGAHSWHEGDDGTWWEGIKEVFETSGGPVGVQGTISWLFIPGLIAGVFFNVDQDYLFLYTVLFIFAFIGMEMAKPSKPSHFEPEMYKLKE